MQLKLLFVDIPSQSCRDTGISKWTWAAVCCHRDVDIQQYHETVQRPLASHKIELSETQT
jgi:hypothetical protein